MDFQIKLGTDGIDWSDLDQMFQLAPLGTRPPEAFKRACEYSPLIVTIWDKNRVIGFGRALTDFKFYASIHDVVVRKEFQNRGVGKKIILSILEHVRECNYVTLFVVPERSEFYAKLGFRKLDASMIYIKDQGHLDKLKSRHYIEE